MDEESPPSENFEVEESVSSLMTLLKQAGMEKELANMKESYLKGVKPLTTYKELQRELELLEGGDLPFTKKTSASVGNAQSRNLRSRCRSRIWRT